MLALIELFFSMLGCSCCKLGFDGLGCCGEHSRGEHSGVCMHTSSSSEQVKSCACLAEFGSEPCCIGCVLNKSGCLGGANWDSGTSVHVRAIDRLGLCFGERDNVDRFKLLKYDDSCLPLPGGNEEVVERGVDAATESMLAAALAHA